MQKRPSKKTETIEIRLSPELKSALGQISRGRGRSMSEMVRDLIEGEVDGPRPSNLNGDHPMTLPNPARLWRMFALTVPVVALAALYLLTAQGAASASEEARVVFAELDRDGNGLVTQPEVEAFLTSEGWMPEAACGTPDEDPCTLAEMAASQLDRVDSDGDGTASFQEVSALILRDRAVDFLDMDIDENGYLSVDELVAGELYWVIDEPEIAAEEGIEISAPCADQFAAEMLDGIAVTCGFAAEARVELAVYDVNQDGRISLMEFLEH